MARLAVMAAAVSLSFASLGASMLNWGFSNPSITKGEETTSAEELGADTICVQAIYSGGTSYLDLYDGLGSYSEYIGQYLDLSADSDWSIYPVYANVSDIYAADTDAKYMIAIGAYTEGEGFKPMAYGKEMTYAELLSNNHLQDTMAPLSTMATAWYGDEFAAIAAPIPEPTSGLLVLVGLAGVYWKRRRAKRA